jgi:4-methyl-5(b-hydroxyethyl)-thiazole monophosphate biosynthesis
MAQAVLVLLAEGFEEIEAVCLIDLLRRAGLQVTTAALQHLLVNGAHGIPIQADQRLAEVEHQHFDLILLPGGLLGTHNLAHDPRVIQLLQQQHQQEGWLGAICAAPMVLAQAGLLHNKTITCYPGTLAPDQPQNGHHTGNAIEQDGKIVTSRGPGTALDFGLILIELLAGLSIRQQVEQALMR